MQGIVSTSPTSGLVGTDNLWTALLTSSCGTVCNLKTVVAVVSTNMATSMTHSHEKLEAKQDAAEVNNVSSESAFSDEEADTEVLRKKQRQSKAAPKGKKREPAPPVPLHAAAVKSQFPQQRFRCGVYPSPMFIIVKLPAVFTLLKPFCKANLCFSPQMRSLQNNDGGGADSLAAFDCSSDPANLLRLTVPHHERATPHFLKTPGTTGTEVVALSTSLRVEVRFVATVALSGVKPWTHYQNIAFEAALYLTVCCLPHFDALSETDIVALKKCLYASLIGRGDEDYCALG
mgnify:CR=1 FL=1